MRNILITVLMILVVVLMFNSIIMGADGTKEQIEAQGRLSNNAINSLNTPTP